MEGQSSAIFSLGMLYYKGVIEQNIPKDYEKAYEYFLQTSKMGNSNSYNLLGLCYLNGHGVEKNMQKAVDCFEQGVKVGNAEAINNLGLMHDNGDGIIKNHELAYMYYRQAASLGNQTARKNVLIMDSLREQAMSRREERKK